MWTIRLKKLNEDQRLKKRSGINVNNSNFSSSQGIILSLHGFIVLFHQVIR